MRTQGSVLGSGGWRGWDQSCPQAPEVLRPSDSVCGCSIDLVTGRLISVNLVNYDSKERSTEVHVVYPFPLFGNPVSPHTDGSHFVMEKGCFEERIFFEFRLVNK